MTAATALSVMVVTAAYNVFTRYVLKDPKTWAEELECICLIWSTFPGAAACYKRNLHYGMDYLVDHLPLKAKLMLRRCITFLCIFLFGYLCYISFGFAVSATKTTTFFRLSYTYLDFAAVFGFFSMTVYSVIYFVESLSHPEAYAARYAAAYEDEDDMQRKDENV